jgi:hypothetical protein
MKISEVIIVCVIVSSIQAALWSLLLPPIKFETPKLVVSTNIAFQHSYAYCIDIIDKKRAVDCMIDVYEVLKKFELDNRGVK